MMNRRAVCIVALLIIGLSHAAARGSLIIYTTLGVDDSFNTSSSRVVGNTGGENFMDAMPFTVSLPGELGSITAPVANLISPNVMYFSLDADKSGSPGSVLESWTVSGLSTSPAGSADSLVTLTSVLHPMLAAATNYWLVASEANGSAQGAWFDTNQSVSGFKFSTNGGTTWTNAAGNTIVSAFDVAIVPEPEIALMLLPIAGLLLRRRLIAR